MKYNWYLMILLLLSTFVYKTNIELYSDVTSNECEHINELNNIMTSESEELLDNTSILKTMIFRSDLKLLNLVILNDIFDYSSVRVIISMDILYQIFIIMCMIYNITLTLQNLTIYQNFV